MDRSESVPFRKTPLPDEQTAVREQTHAFARLSLIIITIGLFCLIGAQFVEGGPGFVQGFRETNPPVYWLLYVLNLLRYAIVPLVTIYFVLSSAARFVQEIYGLSSPQEGFRFVTAAMFGSPFLSIRVRKGKVEGGEWELKQMEAIGGPGSVVIAADSVALFQRTRTPSNTATNRGYFLAPFERIDINLSLEDQEGTREEVRTVTRDGIQVRLTDVRFRYRILHSEEDGAVHVRSLQRPYSYADEALRSIAYGTPVNKDGEGAWQNSVAFMLTGAIIGFINERPVDYLTAPKISGQAPRREINERLFTQVQRRLKGAGAQLLWIDVGHIDIITDEVDQDRVARWAVHWAGDAASRRAYAQATLNAYKELGKAEAQAEMIMGITHALKNVDLSSSSRAQFSTLLLMRATQILEEIKVNPAKGEGSK